MKTLDWQNFFSEQRARHGKVVFSVAELANAARTTLHQVNTQLGRLVHHGLITRYAQGHYGLIEGVSPEEIVRVVDCGAYITGFYTLFRCHLVMQVPTEVTCFTDRRHNRRADRITPAGRLRFICAPPPIYSKPAKQTLASAEQALCDFIWLNSREGLDTRSLVTFRNVDRINRRRLHKIMKRYPDPVQTIVAGIIAHG